MKHFLSILFFCLACARACGAAGDIVGAMVETNGYILKLWISGLSTNGTYNFGLTSTSDLLNVPRTPTAKISGTTCGYDDDGNAINYPIDTVVTYRLRQAYPNDSLVDETIDGGNVVLRLSLSDFWYNTDSNLVLTASSGLYRQASTDSQSGYFTVTNNSTLTHAKCVANWYQPGYQRITGNTMTVRAGAWHRSGQKGRPVRRMLFTAKDESGDTATATLTAAPGIDTTQGDAVPVVEYIGNIDVSSLTQGDQIRVDFKAWPWRGDSGAIVDTSDGVWATFPIINYGPITNLLDRTGAYGYPYAYVATNGVVGGVVSTTAATAAATPFDTIENAASAIAAFNSSNYSRNDTAGEIRLRAGTYAFAGGSGSYGNIPETYCRIVQAPEDSPGTAIIGSQSGNYDIRDRLWFEGITFSGTFAAGMLDNSEVVVFKGCTFSTSASRFLASAGAGVYNESYALQCTVTSFGQGFQSTGSSDVHWKVVRGCNMGSMNSISRPYVFIGNKWTGGTTATLISQSVQGTQITPFNYSIYAFNKFPARNNSSSICVSMLGNGGTNVIYGAVVAQNEWEHTATSGNANLLCYADGHVANANHVIVVHNTSAGQRFNLCYLDTGTTSYERNNWTVAWNATDNTCIKTDPFTGSGGASGARVGNWTGVWGVGWHDNHFGQKGTVGANGLFGQFIGLRSRWENGMATNVMQYVTDGSQNGSAAGSGSGDYALKSTSPAQQTAEDFMLAWDIEGKPRGRFAPFGAYSRQYIGRTSGGNHGY